MAQTTFYFDLGSPYAYLTAERIADVLPESASEPVSWVPVSLGGLFKLTGRSSWSLAGAERRASGIAEVQRRAALYGLPPVSWPDPWPTNYLFAMRVATFAFRIGRGREFTLQAFRAAFQRGRDLAIEENVLDAAVEVGIDRGQARDAAADPQVKLALIDATEHAHQLGVFGVPTLVVGDEVFWGDDRVDDVARLAP